MGVRKKSSIKVFETIFMTFQRFIWRLVWVVLCPVALSFLLVVAVSWRSGDSITPSVIAKMQIANPFLAWAGPLRLYAAVKQAHLDFERYDVIVMGASRAGQFRSGMFRPYRFYNAAMTGWSLQRQIELFDEMTSRFKPKVVIFNLDYFMLAAGYEERWEKVERRMVRRYNPVEVMYTGMQSLSLELLKQPKATVKKVANKLLIPSHEIAGGLRVFGATPREGVVSMFRRDGSMRYFDYFYEDAPKALKNFSPVLSQVNEGGGQKIDLRQMAMLEKLGMMARERGVTLVGVQLPFPETVISILDRGETVEDNQQKYDGGDMRIWNEFRTDDMRNRLRDLGIIFLDFTRLRYLDTTPCFIDSAHPAEYLVLASSIGLLQQSQVRKILPAVDTDRLEDRLRKAELEGECFHVFDDVDFQSG